MPAPMDKEIVQKNAALEQEQRAYERQIRKLKRLEEGCLAPEDKESYTVLRKNTQKELREFIKAHSDTLRRDPWREKIYKTNSEDIEKEYKSALKEQKTDTMMPPELARTPDVGYNISVASRVQAIKDADGTTRMRVYDKDGNEVFTYAKSAVVEALETSEDIAKYLTYTDSFGEIHEVLDDSFFKLSLDTQKEIAESVQYMRENYGLTTLPSSIGAANAKTYKGLFP